MSPGPPLSIDDCNAKVHNCCYNQDLQAAINAGACHVHSTALGLMAHNLASLLPSRHSAACATSPCELARARPH